MTRGLEPLFGINTRYVAFRDYDDIVTTPTIGIKLGSQYVKEITILLGCIETEKEECGICYSNESTITSNC
jgi:hypothetical protein